MERFFQFLVRFNSEATDWMKKRYKFMRYYGELSSSWRNYQHKNPQENVTEISPILKSLYDFKDKFTAYIQPFQE